MITKTIDSLQAFLRKYISYNAKMKEVNVSSLKVDKNGKYFLIVEEDPHKTKNFICKVYSITDQNGNEYAIPNDPKNSVDWIPLIGTGSNRSIGIVIPSNQEIYANGVQPYKVKYQISSMYDRIIHGVPDEKLDYGISINLGLAVKNNRYLGNPDIKKQYSGLFNTDEDMYVKYVDFYDGIIILYIWQDSGYERDTMLDNLLSILNWKSEEIQNILSLEVDEITGENEENFGKKYLYQIKIRYNQLVNEYFDYMQDDSEITSIDTQLSIYSGNLMEVKGRLSGNEIKRDIIRIDGNFIDNYLVDGHITNTSVQTDRIYTYETLNYSEVYNEDAKRQIVFSVKNILDVYNIDRIKNVQFMGYNLDYELVGTDLYAVIEDVIDTIDFSKPIMMEYLHREFSNDYDLDLENNTISIYGDNIDIQYVEIWYLDPNIKLDGTNMIEEMPIEI